MRVQMSSMSRLSLSLGARRLPRLVAVFPSLQVRVTVMQELVVMACDHSLGQAEPAAAQQSVGGHGGHGEAEQHDDPRADQEQAALPQVKGKLVN